MTDCSCLSIKESVKDQLVDASRGFHGLGVGSHALFGHNLLAYVSPGVKVPARIHGIPVKAKYTRPVRSLSARYPVVRTLDAFARPVSGGNSVGAYSPLLLGYVTGTVGMAFQTVDGKTLILSNNHVIAGIDTVQRNGATAGSPLFQPGSYYGGAPGPSDNFATLYQWGKIDENNMNTLDWATGLVNDPTQVSAAILNVGTPALIADAVVGLPVAKMGALSGLTRGTVIDVNATIDVNYEDVFTTTFDDQVVVDGGASPFAIPGDSGSVVVASVAGQLVATGLLFSGSSTIAVCNKLTQVQNAFGPILPLTTIQSSGVPVANTSILPALLAMVGAASQVLVRKSAD